MEVAIGSSLKRFEFSLIEPSDRAKWNKFVLSFSSYSYLQSYEWGEFKQRDSWDMYPYALTNNAAILGTIILMTPKNVFLKNKFFSSPYPPALDYNNPVICDYFFQYLSKELKRRKAGFLKFSGIPLCENGKMSVFVKYGFREPEKETVSLGLARMPVTLVLNLKGENEHSIKRKFNQTTRNCITKSFKEGVKVKEVTTEKQLGLFYKLYLKTARRRNFLAPSYPYFENLFRMFCCQRNEHAPRARILLAYHKEEPIAGISVILFGCKAAELHACFDSDYGYLKPNHRLVFEAIKWAIQNRCMQFDFTGGMREEKSGMLDRIQDQRLKEAFRGISIFKRGFGGENHEYIAEMDLPFQRTYYRLWQAMNPCFKIYRRIKEFLRNYKT